jgi:hypothetical protein
VLVLNDNVALVHPDPELDPLDILLCWHESGNGPKTNSRQGRSLPRVVGRLSPAVGVLAALGEADPART